MRIQRSVLLIFLAALAAPLPLKAAQPAVRPDNRPVTVDQYNALVRAYRSLLQRVDKAEEQIRSGAGAGGKAPSKASSDGTIDLSAPAQPGAAPVPTMASNPHGGGRPGENPFKVYFDLNLVNRPNIRNLSFDNYHTLLFFESTPLPEYTFTFAFDIATRLRQFELDYQVNKKLQLRFGFIWIPFDDMSPHNIFGGRVNVTRLSPDTTNVYLPDIWTDKGVALKYQLVENTKLSMVAHAYIVNGFGSGGSDPVSPAAPEYPSFSDLSVQQPDNNRDKAFGGRLHATIMNRLGLGASFYSGRFDSDTGIGEAHRLTITGADAQLRLGPAELRTGWSSMKVNLATRDFTRGGMYGEIGYRFGRKKDWKVLGRGGTIQLDDQAIAVTDQQLVGATLLYKPGMVEYSIEHSRDLKVVEGKANYSYTNLRVIMAF